MTMMVDIHSMEFQTYIKKMVLETIQESIADMPPKTDIAMLLHLHIKDMQAFKSTVESQLSEINGRLDRMDGRLDRVEERLDSMDERLDSMDGRLTSIEKVIKETMFTKADWERESLRLIQGIGVEVKKIFDAKFKSDPASKPES